MNSSNSRSKNNKSKNWNIFRSPQQKDLFDFLDHEYPQETDQDKQNHPPNHNSHNLKHKRNPSTWKNTDTIQEQNPLSEKDQNSWRSNMTFATLYQEGESSKIKSLHNEDKFFKATRSRSKKMVLNEEEQDMLLTSRHKEDSLSNIFLKQITRTEQNEITSSQNEKKKLFENINMKTSQNFGITYMDNNMILKTLNEIKEINKENLFVNKQILSTIQRKSEGRSVKRGKTVPHPVVKSTQKKCSIQKINHQASSKGFSQSRNEFYLYDKPARNSSNGKLSQNRAILLYKKLPINNNTTQFSNLTKYSLANNTTKLSLGDRTLGTQKPQVHNQSKSTIKKVKGVKKLSSIQLDEHVDRRISEIQKIKSSLNMVLKKNNNQVPIQKTVIKTANKKKSKSQFAFHS